MSKDTEIHYRMLVAKTTLEQNLRKILGQAPSHAQLRSIFTIFASKFGSYCP